MPMALAICSKFPCAYVAIGVQGFGLSRAFPSWVPLPVTLRLTHA
jgi:hypothetical protein